MLPIGIYLQAQVPRALQYLATSMAATTKVRDCTPHYRAEGDFYFRANNALWVQ